MLLSPSLRAHSVNGRPGPAKKDGQGPGGRLLTKPSNRQCPAGQQRRGAGCTAAAPDGAVPGHWHTNSEAAATVERCLELFQVGACVRARCVAPAASFPSQRSPGRFIARRAAADAPRTSVRKARRAIVHTCRQLVTGRPPPALTPSPPAPLGRPATWMGCASSCPTESWTAAWTAGAPSCEQRCVLLVQAPPIGPLTPKGSWGSCALVRGCACAARVQPGRLAACLEPHTATPVGGPASSPLPFTARFPQTRHAVRAALRRITTPFQDITFNDLLDLSVHGDFLMDAYARRGLLLAPPAATRMLSSLKVRQRGSCACQLCLPAASPAFLRSSTLLVL